MPQPNPILPADTQTYIDALLAGQRRDTCQVRTKSVTVDRGGAQVESWGAWGESVGCLVTPTNRAIQEGISGGRVSPEADVEIRVHRDVVVSRDDQILHLESGQVFDVLNDPTIPTDEFELVISGKDSDG